MMLILIFPIDREPLRLAEVSEGLQTAAGFPCFAYEREKKLSPADLPDGAEMSQGTLWVELPERTDEDGEPIVNYEVHPRLDRSEELQGVVDEVLSQDEDLDDALNRNSYDVLLTAEEEHPAGLEALYYLTYVIAAGTGGGILIPGREAHEEETIWFDAAEDFLDAVSGEDEEEPGE